MNSKPKILHIIDTLSLGGAQTLLINILKTQKTNPDIYLFALRKRPIQFKITKKNIFVFPSYKKFSFAPIPKLKEFIQNNKIDILHCHLFKSQLFGWILKSLFFPGIKLIFHEHGNILRNKPLINVLPYLAKHQVDLFICVSNACKISFIKKCSISKYKLMVMHNGIELSKFNNPHISLNQTLTEKTKYIKKGDFVVGYMGRITAVKGWKEFVLSIPILLNKNPNMKFLMAGSGADKKNLTRLINELNLGRNLIFLGFIAEVQHFFSLLDCLAIPSHAEGMGIIALEAMACGVPIVASDVAALNEILTHEKNALLCAPRNSKDLADKIALIQDNDIRQQLIKNGQKEIQKYSLHNYLVNLNAAYNSLMGNSTEDL